MPLLEIKNLTVAFDTSVGLFKAVGLWLAIQLGGGIGFMPVLAIGLLAGRFA